VEMRRWRRVKRIWFLGEGDLREREREIKPLLFVYPRSVTLS